ncbi:hypothetical protein VTJ49DRAFT_1355 [Mycothermus thermophilus]|uniref:Protein YAE1 n=1 Tax=Humicola insolens TaxID=85995 RepID=A0ABR3VPK9_HUMIN
MLLRHAPVEGDPDIFVAMSPHHHPAATAEAGPNMTITNPTSNNNLDDVWAADDDHHHHTTHQPHLNPPHEPHQTSRPALSEPSDIPRLAQAHHTAGYRDGIALAKSRFAQPGFDEGYPLGAALGARAGELLGVLEGLAAAVGLVSLHSSFPPSPPSSSAGSSSALVQGGGDAEAGRMERLLAEARRELGPQAVFAEEYFAQEDGTWRYEVCGDEGKEEVVVFADVAEAHPLLRKWRGIVRGEAARYGVDLEIFGREEGGWGSGTQRDGDEEDGEEDVGRRQAREKESRPVVRRGGKEAFAW